MSQKNLINNMKVLLKITIPLILSSMAGLIMLIIDGLCLARYSRETLAASGPAMFNASLVITLFTGIVSITRVFVGQANGDQNKDHLFLSACGGILLAILLGIVLILLRPLIQMLPELSNRAEEVKILERQYLGYISIYGIILLVNCAFASILNGIMKFRITMIIGIIVSSINIFLTIGFVFGKFGLPELGMIGSPTATLFASIIGFVCYMIALYKSNMFDLIKNRSVTLNKMRSMVFEMTKIGGLTGFSQTLDEAAQTIFVWIVGEISALSLMANNVALSVNYIIIIPLSGLGAGTTILIANKIGSDEKSLIKPIIKAAFTISFIFIGIVFLLEIIFSNHIAGLFMPENAEVELLELVVNLIGFLFAYGIGFAVSMIMGGALEAVGLARYILYVRLSVEYILCLPIIFLFIQNNIGKDSILKGCWIIYSAFELLIGFIYAMIFKRKGLSQKRLMNE